MTPVQIPWRVEPRFLGFGVLVFVVYEELALFDAKVVNDVHHRGVRKEDLKGVHVALCRVLD